MNCPRCSAPLREAKVEEVLLDKCDACRGVWFDFAEMERVTVKERRALRDVMGSVETGEHTQPAVDEHLNCPRCGDVLLTVRSTEHPDLQIEACLSCYGRWLDGGELGRVRNKGLWRKLTALCRRVL